VNFYLGPHVAVLAQEHRHEAARAEDALRLILMQR
jgi:hypothetical protein